MPEMTDDEARAFIEWSRRQARFYLLRALYFRMGDMMIRRFTYKTTRGQRAVWRERENA